jgi:peptide-methionine (R)-S-oxide reductase
VIPNGETPLNYRVKDPIRRALAACGAGDRLGSNDTLQPDLGKGTGRAFFCGGDLPVDKLEKPLEAWREELSETQFHVCRLGGTERAFSGEYHDSKTPGIYHCACCGTALFDSDAKFDSGSGWPSYFQPLSKEAITSLDDFSHGMHRIEVKCGKCDAHLGHVFPDGPAPTGLRYCINSAALKLVPRT